MYESYFGLAERPFSIAPDPQYLYMSARHKEAMAHLSYGLSQGGCFIVLTGEVGTGKTTLCRNLMTDLPENVDVALILNANINETELLQTICDELKINYQENNSQKQLLDLINEYLLSSFANNRHTVLIIDEAQLLSRDVLEQVRLLTNLETTKNKLLQIILIGQPELSDLLTRNDLRQLAQRVTARYHLGALRGSEINEYVNYRLGVAGCKQPLFSKQALTKLHQLSDGIPRKINVLADHALLSAYSQSQRSVDSKNIKQAANEVFFNSDSDLKKHVSINKWWLLALALILLNLFLWWYFLGINKGPISSDNSQVEQPRIEGAQQAETVNEPDVNISESVNEGLAEVVVQSDVGELGQQTELESSVPVQIDQSLSLDQSLPETGAVIVSNEYLDAEEAVPDDVGGNRILTEAIAPVEPLLINDSGFEQTQFGSILETSADLTGRANAFRELGQLWNITLPVQMLKPMCETVQENGLACISVANWQKMLRLNRPAVVLLSHQGQLHRVVVEVVDGEAAEVRIAGTIYRVSVEELQARWQGEGTIMWRPSQAGTRLLQPEDNNSAVPAVRAYLNRALAQAQLPILTSVEETRFDLEMSQKVFALQTLFNIVSDSKIGNETYLLMNELVAPDTMPVLRQRLP